MKFAGRMNSFMFKGDKDLFQTIEAYKNIDGITHLEFNYPEHIEGYDIENLKACMGDLKVNGVATRFKDHYIAGEFTNPDEGIRRDAIEFCKKGIDGCRMLGGNVLTIWQAYDGYDYPFQMEYESSWKRMIEAFREIADYAAQYGIKVSIEYKPFEPRNFAMLDSIGTTMMAVEEIDRENLGVTLDFCHMLMKHDEPAFALSMAASKGRLFGLHMNDGYSAMDSGLIFGSVNLSLSLEFVYYLKKYNYDGVVFFDSFPVREDTQQEIESNIRSFRALDRMVDKIGMEKIAETIAKQDGVCAHELVMSALQ